MEEILQKNMYELALHQKELQQKSDALYEANSKVDAQKESNNQLKD